MRLSKPYINIYIYMEEIEANEQEQRIIKIPAIEIIRKLRTKINRENFVVKIVSFFYQQIGINPPKNHDLM